MENILIVTKSEGNRDNLARFLNKSNYNSLFTASSQCAAKELLSQKDFSAVIIDTPLDGGGEIEFSLFIAQNYKCGCMLLVKSDKEEETAAKTENQGIIVIPKPVNPQYFCKMLRIAVTSARRLRDIDWENKKLQSKIEELKIIDRAKCLLIEKLKMTETQAHRHIEKQAMDLRQTKKTIAENILKTYEY